MQNNYEKSTDDEQKTSNNIASGTKETTDKENQLLSPLVEHFWNKTTWLQIGYGLWVNQVIFTIGLNFGFSSVSIPQLRKSTALFPSTLSEQAWITSVVVLTAPIGCLISGFTLDKFGRRKGLVLCQVPFVLGWMYIGCAKSAVQMILGRAIAGVGVGMCTSPPRVYCTEITLPYMRGAIGVFPTIFLASGFTFEGILGLLRIHWTWVCFFCACYSAFVMILNWFLPESPYYLLMSDDIEKTIKALKRIRAKDFNIEKELYQMQDFKKTNQLHKLSTKRLLREVFKPYACKPFAIIMGYILFGSLVGINIILFWTVDILTAAQVSVDQYVGFVSIAATRIVSAICSSIIMFFAPRRPMAIGSALAMGVLCISLGAYLSNLKENSIIPLIALMLYMVIASLGYYPLPFLMLFESIPLQIRGILGGITVSLSFVIMFIVIKSFPYIRRALNISTILIIFGINSLIACVYLTVFLHETRGLSLQEIEEYFKGKRSCLQRGAGPRSKLQHQRTIGVYQRDLANARLQELSQHSHTSENNTHTRRINIQ